MSENIVVNTPSLKTELTLGLPGEIWLKSSCTKRKYAQTIDLRLGMSHCNDRVGGVDMDELKNKEANNSPKEQVVGWPPVRGNSTKNTKTKSFKYVKVVVDGAPYLRKVNLENYNSYCQLQNALQNLFPSLNIRNVLDEKEIRLPANGVEYVQTYEDEEGDWMLVGDVPWEMFVESCKKMRLVRGHH